jgi:hypothetical protein
LFYTFLLVLAAVMSLTLPESPGWLMNTDRYDEALVVFNKIAYVNSKKELSLETQL